MTERLQILQDNSFEVETSLLIDETDFNCEQPIFLNGIYAGSRYVYLDAIFLPDGLRIYLNTGDFGVVKDNKCLIKLRTPISEGDIIYGQVSTEKCNIKTCEFIASALVSGDPKCVSELNRPISGTSTGEFTCLGVDLHRLKYDDYGRKVLGDVVQLDCYLCGGVNPSCE